MTGMLLAFEPDQGFIERPDPKPHTQNNSVFLSSLVNLVTLVINLEAESPLFARHAYR